MFILIGFLGGGALGVARFPKQIANVPMNLITVSSGATDRASSTGVCIDTQNGQAEGQVEFGSEVDTEDIASDG